MIAGAILGVAFIDQLDRQHLRIGLAVVAVVIAGCAALGTRSLSFEATRVTTRRLSIAVLGVGALAFAANVASLSRVNSGSEMAVYVAGTLALIAFGVAYLFVAPLERYWFGFLVAYAGVTIALIADVIPFGNFSDVQLFHHDAVAALVRGENPFAMTFPDIYPPAASARFYGEGVSIDGVLQFGWPYFPLSLLVVAPFELVTDYRIGLVLALVAAAILMSRLTPSAHSTIAAMAFLLISPSVVAARNGWSDPLVLLALVGVVFATVHHPRGRSAVTGALFAIKQYTVFLAVPTILAHDRPWSIQLLLRHFAFAGAVFLLITLPFVVWNPSAFWGSVVELQFLQPFRPDSIALPALVPDWWRSLPPAISIGAPFLAMALASAAVAWKTPTGGQGVALGAAFVLLVAFVTSKQAFVNYYLVAIGALFSAAAAVAIGEEDPTGRPPDRTATTVGARVSRDAE